LGVSFIRGVELKSECLIGARLSDFKECVEGESLFIFNYEISVLGTSWVVEFRLRLFIWSEDLQFLGRMRVESEKLCGVIVIGSASGGVEFPEPDLSL
jgi:hypothetical protein